MTRANQVLRAVSWHPSWTRPSSAGCWRRCSTKTSSSAPSASARCRASTPIIPMSSRPAARNTVSSYLPAESDTGMFGGNSNWRGPIWMPVNALIIRRCSSTTLLRQRLHRRMSHRLRPAMNLYQVAEEITRRLASIFLKQRMAGGRSTAERGSSRRPALARLRPVLRVLPRRQRRRPGRQPSDRLDRHRRPRPCTCSRPPPPSRCSSSARWPRD